MANKIPATIQELYDMMCNNPRLCGKFKITSEGIIWDLFPNIRIDIGLNSVEGYISLTKKLFGAYINSLTHWHPELDEIYDEICAIGEADCVLVITASLLGEAVRFMGKKQDCPFPFGKKFLFCRTYWLYAR